MAEELPLFTEAHGLLPAPILSLLGNKLGYKDLSSIQKSVCSHLKSENSRANFIAKAKNGSGKSLALTIALFNNLKDQPKSTENEQSIGIQGLVLAPTREIAIQLFDFFNLLVKELPEK